jgi:NAD(P)-dependent dehydrogenase (short-subunit alcohol dehydrogenase family)
MTERLTALQVVDGMDLSGKTCVITGASSGLGRESARALAAAGAHVVLAARNRDALAQTAQWVAGEAPDARVSTVPLDLTALAGVRAAARAIGEIAPVIDVLMNNAGVMFTPFGRTRDGYETQIGTNHFGHFELTRLLVGQLAAAGGARIVNLSSAGHALGDVDFDDPNWEGRDYDKFVAYGASKTANILHANEADRRLRESGIRAFAVHPGTVATSLARYMSRADFARLREMAATRGGALDLITPEQRGAATQVWAAVSPELAGKGALYLADCGISDAVAPYAGDEQRAADWWILSEKLCDRTRIECAPRHSSVYLGWDFDRIPAVGSQPSAPTHTRRSRANHGSGRSAQSADSRELNRGGRRSRKAVTPSRASAVPITRWCSWVSSDATCRGL